MTTKTCTNGHVMTGIGFDECPECEAPWMTTPTVEEIARSFRFAGKNNTSLGCCGGDYCTTYHDKEIEHWLRTTLTTYGNARYEEGVKAERVRVLIETKDKLRLSKEQYDTLITILSTPNK